MNSNPHGPRQSPEGDDLAEPAPTPEGGVNPDYQFPDQVEEAVDDEA